MKDRFGLQLYSVREEIKANGFPAMLETVKRAGYDCVEFAGFYGYSPEEVVKLLKASGLDGISAHIGLGDIEAQLPYIDAIGMSTPAAATRYSNLYPLWTALRRSWIFSGRWRQDSPLRSL